MRGMKYDRESRTRSPIGILTIREKDGAICRIELALNDHDVSEESTSPLLLEARKQIEQYFSGQRKTFDLPLQMNGSPFDRNVWNALLDIPYGKTVGYGEIAHRIGRRNAARAVGGAVGRNPLLIVVPCHRVIRSNGELGGFAAGIDAKKTLQQTEGICHIDPAL